MEKLPDFFNAITKEELKKTTLSRKGQIEYAKDKKLLMLWKKVNEIIRYINSRQQRDDVIANDILIEVSRMIERRTGK